MRVDSMRDYIVRCCWSMCQYGVHSLISAYCKLTPTVKQNRATHNFASWVDATTAVLQETMVALKGLQASPSATPDEVRQFHHRARGGLFVTRRIMQHLLEQHRLADVLVQFELSDDAGDILLDACITDDGDADIADALMNQSLNTSSASIISDYSQDQSTLAPSQDPFGMASPTGSAHPTQGHSKSFLGLTSPLAPSGDIVNAMRSPTPPVPLYRSASPILLARDGEIGHNVSQLTIFLQSPFEYSNYLTHL